MRNFKAITTQVYGYLSMAGSVKGLVIETEGGLHIVNRPSGVYVSADAERVTFKAPGQTRTFHPGSIDSVTVYRHNGEIFNGSVSAVLARRWQR